MKDFLKKQKVVKRGSKTTMLSKIKKWHFGAIIAVLIATVAIAAGYERIPKDEVKIGSETASDKTVTFADDSANDSFIRKNNTTGKLQFSHDGLKIENIGSGSGGGSGINLLSDNDGDHDFEGATIGDKWTASGGTLIYETSNNGFGAASGSWDASALSQTLVSIDLPVIKGLEGRNCLAQGQYKYTGTLGDYKARVELDDNSPLTSDFDLSDTLGVWTPFQIAFQCPTADSVRIEFEAGIADPAIILLDDIHVGSDVREVEVSQATPIATIIYKQNAVGGCEYTTLSGDFPQLITSNTGTCDAATIEYSSTTVTNTSDPNSPDAIFPYLPKGVYEVSLIASPRSATASGCTMTQAITDDNGASYRGIGHANNYNGDLDDDLFIVSKALFSYSTGGTRTFAPMIGCNNANLQEYNLNADASVTRALTWIIKRFPNDTETAIQKPETQGAILRAYHNSSDCNWGNVTNTAYVDPAIDASCTFTVEKSTGFSNVSSADDGTPGNNFPGVEFTPSATGDFYACANFAMLGATATAYYSARILANGATSIAETSFRGAGGSESDNISICGVLSVSTVSLQELKLQGRGTSGLFNVGETSATGAARGAVEWTVYSLTQQFPQAVLLNDGYDPTELSLERATKIGVQKYLCNKAGSEVAYNGGNKATITSDVGSWSTVDSCELFPYQAADGSWYVKGNAHLQHGTLDGSQKGLLISDLESPPANSSIQSFVGRTSNSASCGSTCTNAIYQIDQALFGNPVTTMFIDSSAATNWNWIHITFDFKLDHKPNWAY